MHFLFETVAKKFGFSDFSRYFTLVLTLNHSFLVICCDEILNERQHLDDVRHFVFESNLSFLELLQFVAHGGQVVIEQLIYVVFHRLARWGFKFELGAAKLMTLRQPQISASERSGLARGAACTA